VGRGVSVRGSDWPGRMVGQLWVGLRGRGGGSEGGGGVREPCVHGTQYSLIYLYSQNLRSKIG